MKFPPDLEALQKRSVPMIYGAEGAECGLACLAMVAAAHGNSLGMYSLRQRFGLSMAGATLKSMMEMADQIGLSARALRSEVGYLAQVSCPAILHWDLSHFVVLVRARGNSFLIHDPARGARSMSAAEVSEHFSGVLLELSPQAVFKAQEPAPTVKLWSLWSSMTGLKGVWAQVVVLSLSLQLFALVLPFQLQLVVDRGIQNEDTSLLRVIAIGFALVILLSAVTEYVRGWLVQAMGQIFTFQVTANIVRHLIRLKSDFFEKRHVGDILSRVNSASFIQDVITRGLITSIIDGVMALATLVILFIYSPSMAAVVVALLSLSVLLQQGAYPFVRERARREIIEQGIEQSYLMETVRSATTIKLLSGEIDREARWKNLYARFIDASLSAARLRVLISSIQSLISGLTITIIIYLAAVRIAGQGDFTIGMMFAFLALRQTFWDRALGLVSQLTQFRLIQVHLDRLSDIVLSDADDLAASDGHWGGDISCRDLTFQYGTFDKMVLKEVSLEVKQGQFIALTGPSGGGKTTLVKLLTGLMEPSAGEVLLDGRIATPAAWRAFRKGLGIVSQDDRLVSGSIADNIAFFDVEIDMNRVAEAARLSRIDGEIEKMPMGYLSLIGDMGSSLSGGQKQRVLLARALYRNPKILILDEGTANLDPDNETEIAALIASLAITRIVIAHRPALVNLADRVYCLEDGRLTALS